MKKIILFLCSFLAGAYLFGGDKISIYKPGKNTVTVIGKFTVDGNYDVDFLREALGMEGCKVDNAIYSKQSISSDINPFVDRKDESINRIPNGAFFAKTIKLNKDRLIKYPIQNYFLLESKEPKINGYRIEEMATRAYVQLPLFIQFEVPEGDQYVYIGSFNYKMDNSYNPVLINVEDEYDEAYEFITSIFPKAELVRACLDDWTVD